jgi:tetratricopeptide (TPR) repeat protein
LTSNSSADADLELLRASLLLDADPAAAARRAAQMLSRWPQHEAASLLLATACRRTGDHVTATGLLESLATAHPASSVMQLELGRAYAAAARAPAARAALRRAVEIDAGLADAWRALASQEFLAGDTRAGDEAYARYRRLARIPPEFTEVRAALTEHRLDAAAALLEARLRDVPRDSHALAMLAETAALRGDRATAERRLRQCLDIEPGDSAARYDLANLLYAQQRAAEAIPLIDRLLAFDPQNVSYRCLKARTIRYLGAHAEALAIMHRLVGEHAEDPQVWLLSGNILRETGQHVKAVAAYRQALRVQPDCGEAYFSLANMKTARFTDAEIEAMRAAAGATPDAVGDTHLEFALGKALEDAGCYAESFEHYARGNALQRAAVLYDPAVTTAFVQRSKGIYSAEFFAAREGWGSHSIEPIFIVGLPRGGSTLLEQMLSCHSAVEGTRELPEIPNLVRELGLDAVARSGAGYPELVSALSRDEIAALAALYLRRTAPNRPLGKPRFVDKLLSNFGHIGLIHLLFPRAAIIDARRHPLACGFACYRQLFARGVDFSYDLAELGAYYRDYADLMRHTDAVLPEAVHRVHYEELVADPATVLGRMLEFCGLAFEPGCLEFHDNPRVVMTISSEQVRQPLYSSAVDQWRHYAEWLGPLAAAVGDLAAQYPAVVRVSGSRG